MRRKKEFTIKNPWVLKILGGAFFAMFLRWTEVIFMIRMAFVSSSRWNGLAGPEYVAMALGYYSRFGGAVFAAVTAATGGIDGGQLIATLGALGVWEWRVRTMPKVGKGKKENQDWAESLKKEPVVPAIICLFVLGWLWMQLKVIF